MRAITIGNFDGVHLGHQALLDAARRQVGPTGEVLAMVFDPHPASVLKPGSEPSRLSTFEQRDRWLRGAGADRTIRLVPTPELLALEPDAFIEQLVADFAPTAIVEGSDFHFGKGRRGTVASLEEAGRRLGFACRVVDPVELPLVDQHVVTASSTLVRWLVSHGRVRDAACVLGRSFSIDGVVVRGDRRGRTIGVPTANVRTPCQIPADGVYACLATLQTGATFAAAVNIGPRPTFGVAARAIEAHLLGAPTESDPDGTMRLAGSPEYGWGISLDFVAWLRDPVAFGSLSDLLEQIHRDCERARGSVETSRGVCRQAEMTGMERVS